MEPVPPRRGGFDAAYVRLFVTAQRCSYRILGNRTAAEDVAAETMARAYARWPKIHPYSDAWVTRVAANLALDHLRRRRVAADERPPRDGTSVDRLLLRDELVKLPRRQREAIVLRFLLDLDEQETARALGIGVATVHTHVKRGLARMRTDLTQFGFGEDQQ